MEVGVKLEKVREILEGKRRELGELEIRAEQLSKENYHVKMELSAALSETNAQLVKNKTLS